MKYEDERNHSDAERADEGRGRLHAQGKEPARSGICLQPVAESTGHDGEPAGTPAASGRSGGLNVTTTCSCGQAKEENRQWCEACYARIPEGIRYRFYDRVSSLQALIEAIDDGLEVSRRTW